MIRKTFSFIHASVDYYFDAEFKAISQLAAERKVFLITDTNVYSKHKRRFKGYETIVVNAGEENKTQATADIIIVELIKRGADRHSLIVGVGGGVITDITGYIAGIYMRGIACAFVPTTILAMVDAAIGGKCGVDVGVYKNMVGLIKQPSFILYDYSFLKTLPGEEWVNGFAEIIKHGCIKSSSLFKLLEETSIAQFKKDHELLSKLIRKNALLKTEVVLVDEFEKGERKLLNFGHTFGHAIENLYHIPHGHAVSIGMGIACNLSKTYLGFKDAERVCSLLKKYGLPPQFDFDKEECLRILRSDKKKHNDNIDFIMLDRIGKASINKLSFSSLEESINWA